MANWNLLNHRLQKVTLKVFKKICRDHNIVIKDGELKVILRIIKNNPYPVLNEDYAPILLFEISKETNEKTCNDFKPIIEQKYLIQEME